MPKGYMLKKGDKVVATHHPSEGPINEIMILERPWETKGLDEPAWIMVGDTSWFYRESELLLVEPVDGL
jgi:hypothetical protein